MLDNEAEPLVDTSRDHLITCRITYSYTISWQTIYARYAQINEIVPFHLTRLVHWRPLTCSFPLETVYDGTLIGRHRTSPGEPIDTTFDDTRIDYLRYTVSHPVCEGFREIFSWTASVQIGRTCLCKLIVLIHLLLNVVARFALIMWMELAQARKFVLGEIWCAREFAWGWRMRISKKNLRD